MKVIYIIYINNLSDSITLNFSVFVTFVLCLHIFLLVDGLWKPLDLLNLEKVLWKMTLKKRKRRMKTNLWLHWKMMLMKRFELTLCRKKTKRKKERIFFFLIVKHFLMLNYSCYNRIIIVNVALHEKEIETENVIVTDTGMEYFYFQFSVFFLMT